MIYEKYQGNESEVILTDLPGQEPYDGIGDKAFLSKKEVFNLKLPKKIKSFGNWAFAHMQQLESITVPANEIVLGKQSFLDCPSLRTIFVEGDMSENPGTPYFLATTVGKLKAEALFLPQEISSKTEHEAYMKKYDEALVCFIKESDEKGYEPFFYGWFNDEDGDLVQKPRFIKQRREDKLSLIMLRLQYDMYLHEETKEIIVSYMREYFRENLWDMIIKEYGREVIYMKILADTGLLSKDVRRDLVEALSPGDAEVVAFLLREAEEKADPFMDFSL